MSWTVKGQLELVLPAQLDNVRSGSQCKLMVGRFCCIFRVKSQVAELKFPLLNPAISFDNLFYDCHIPYTTHAIRDVYVFILCAIYQRWRLADERLLLYIK